jgi:hypothetical protein
MTGAAFGAAFGAFGVALAGATVEEAWAMFSAARSARMDFTSGRIGNGRFGNLFSDFFSDDTGSIGPSSRLTTPQIKQMADRLGYKPAGNLRTQSEQVFTNGKDYIVQDRTAHRGGLWKRATSFEGLRNKNTRMGTYDYNLKRAGP